MGRVTVKLDDGREVEAELPAGYTTEVAAAQRLATALSEGKRQLEAAQHRSLAAEIVAEGVRVGVRRALLTSPDASVPAPLVAMTSGYFARSETTDQWAVRRGDGFAYSARPTERAPYEGVGEFMDTWAALEGNKEFLNDERQSGPDLQVAGVVTLTPEQASDATTYNEALKRVGGDWAKIKVAGAESTRGDAAGRDAAGLKTSTRTIRP
jgi:hypothetical protein